MKNKITVQLYLKTNGDTRVGNLLYNVALKKICYGLKDANSGMVALTKTNIGTFWNGHLKIIERVLIV